MKLITALGNPGSKYAQNRHNVGFMLGDELAREYRFSPWKAKFQGQICEGEIAGIRCLLLKPSTFMNLSGLSVNEVLRFYKIDIRDTYVLHDELDLAFNKFRVKFAGGHAGHNGLRSITQHCTDGFFRLRIGIDHPGDKAQVHNHVLGDYSKAELAEVTPALEACARHFGLWLTGKDSEFMNKITLKA
jgi:peptidyl-tRNA hydrolase, PTH1 family